MNIFWLHRRFDKSARAYSNEHMKIILEITQCLFTVHHLTERTTGDQRWRDRFEKIYRLTHEHHPIVKWIGQCRANYVAARTMGLTLCAEFRKRRGKAHACEALLVKLRAPHVFVPPVFKEDTLFATQSIPTGCTPVPLCMPPKYICRNEAGEADLVESYQDYYVNEKMVFKNGRRATFALMPEFIVANALCNLVPNSI